MMSGRTTGPAGKMIMRWRGQQTPLSPLAFGGGGGMAGKKGRRRGGGEEKIDEEMGGSDAVVVGDDDEEKRMMMAMTLDVPRKMRSERDAKGWRLG